MTFGEKVKYLRMKKEMTQADLSKALDVSPRTVCGWESENRRPKSRALFYELVKVLDCDANYLLTENDEDSFISNVSDSYGAKAGQQAREILEQAKALFAGGTIPEEDQLQFMTDIQMLYLDSKKKAKEKYSPKKSEE